MTGNTQEKRKVVRIGTKRREAAVRPAIGIAAAASSDGRCRTVIESVSPEVDAGRFPIKRVSGERVRVSADAFTDGHDGVRCRLLFRHTGTATWSVTEMQALDNDRWQGEFVVTELGIYEYTVEAWTDRYLTWRRDLERRTDPADVAMALRIGAELVELAAGRASGVDARTLRAAAKSLAAAPDPEVGRQQAIEPQLVELVMRYPDLSFKTLYARVLKVIVDRPLARFGAWYELFPRSAAVQSGVHGTFRDCVARLPYVAQMGFDILYLPPIHPIGMVRRKGPNNALTATDSDPGSPWAIGSALGGHRDLHPELGTLDDFKYLLAQAHTHGLELAIDIAFQCAPDHPYVEQHPSWFRFRPDGSVQYAENPPKKYQDIYPFDFESDDWQALHRELIDVVMYWADQGIKVFRVDNPHTKPFSLWEQLIAEVRARHPDVIFLAEAFTRPKVMHRLAKLGFTQSYTYFTWRNTQQELREYFTELSLQSGREYFRPNVWPNTPDILPEYLQVGGRAAFITRVVLAATLSATYGVYGPAFELLEHLPRDPGSEEYLHSEKYQLRSWQLDRPDSIAPIITRLNQIRRQHPALQSNRGLRFLDVDNEQMIAYARFAAGDSQLVIVVANLDPHNPHSGWLTLPLADLGIDSNGAYRVHDALHDKSYIWQGPRNFIRLEPTSDVAHVFVVERHVRNEQEFDQFM